jgi:23S rRNA (adenine2030-N6)-methyltransferase
LLSYRHAFHAGNFADVVKHTVLTLLLCALREKDKPFCYVDTHGGAGRYDLKGAVAQKNREFAGGIELLWRRDDVPSAMAAYVNAVAALNGGGGSALRHYPGSPRLARHFLRNVDRMVLCELHPSEFPALKAEFAGDSQVGVHYQDGYEGLRAHLPPHERRGLVLIDPAYERKDEASRVVDGLAVGYQRWATGMFAIWYPIQSGPLRNQLIAGVTRTGIRRVLLVELCIEAREIPQRLNGTGLFIVNPPWKLADQLASLLPWLHSVLSLGGRGDWRVEWLVPE